MLAAWQGLGYPRRARNLHAAAGVIARDGWPPADRLTDLPGVGPYTAAAIRCFADGEDLLPVDTNAARVVARRFPDGWPGAPGPRLGGRAGGDGPRSPVVHRAGTPVRRAAARCARAVPPRPPEPPSP